MSDSRNTPTLSGVTSSVEANALVQIYNGTTLLKTTQADADGAWSVTLDPLLDGSYSFTAKAVDAAGNISPASGATSTLSITTQAAALALIRDHVTGSTGAAIPAELTYSDAGITGVTNGNLASINTAFAAVAATGSDSVSEVQAVVDSYLAILAAADGTADDDLTLTAAQYQAMALPAINTAAKATLMNDVVEQADTTDVDTHAKLLELARVVDAIAFTAAGGSATPALTASDFALIGLTGVTADNLNAMLATLAAQSDNGSSADSLSELQTLVSTANSAWSNAVIQLSQYDGTQTAPTTETWNLAGVEGVTASVLNVANAYLAPTSTGNSDSTSELQTLADAVNALLLGADGSDNNNASLTPSQYQLLGATGINTIPEASLLNSVIDLKAAADVDSPSELATLAGIVSEVMAVADSGVSAASLTSAELSALGITGVSDAKLAVVLQAIANAAPTDVDTLDKLQAVVTAAVNAQAIALNTLVGYADNGGTAPILSVYSNAGVTGVDSDNLAAINSALASTTITGALVDTTAEVQAIVDAYAAILAEANGSTADATGTDPSVLTYQTVGVSLGSIATNTNGLSLLNDLVGERSASAVDSVSDLNTLADAVNRLLVVASGGTASPAFTASELNALLGISTVTPDNLTAVLQAIAATADNGSGIASLSSLQTVVGYHLFTKLLGVVLFIIEIYWFIWFPVRSELREWHTRKDKIVHSPRSRISASVAGLLLLLFAIPLPTQVAVSALFKPSEIWPVHTPGPAVIDVLHAQHGQAVAKGDKLVHLRAPDVLLQMNISQSRWQRLNWQAATAGMPEGQQGTPLALSQSQLQSAQAEFDRAQQMQLRYQPQAPFAGRFVLSDPDMRPGQWLDKNEKVGVVIGQAPWRIETWVDEDQARRLQIGASAKFLSPGLSQALTAQIVGIDKDSTRVLPDGQLSALHGGHILVREQQGKWIPEQAIYRISLELKQPYTHDLMAVQRGLLSMDANAQSLAGQYLRHALSVVIRELKP